MRRRTLLTALIALMLPFGGLRLRRTLRVERRGKLFIVDGWVLTAADVRALTRDL